MDKSASYKKINDKQQELYKRYTAKIPKYIAKVFDEKLAKNNENFTNFCRRSIEKYIKNN